MSQPQWPAAWAGDDQGSALEVTACGAAASAVAARVPELAGTGVAGGIARRDATLWGPQVEAVASVRLGWVDLPESSLPLVGEVERLRAELAAEGVDRVVLCGMGGSSLAAEVITRTEGVPLVVLDSTDPDQVRAAIGGDDDLARTVVVVSSTSGTMLETDCQRRAFEAAFEAAGIDAASRVVVVTDPGSQLPATAEEAGYRAVFPADPEVGGRFSALSAFGIVPAGLAGADVEGLLDSAAVVADLLADDGEGNPGLVLGAALGGTQPLRDKVVLVDEGSGISGFGDWVEQLLAESTGKLGTGLLPVVVEGPQAPELGWDAADVLVVRLVAAQDPEDAADPVDPGEAEDGTDDTADPSAEHRADDAVGGAEVTVAGPLGAQFLLWEYATAVAGRLLGVNPFDQPDVESAEQAARRLLDTAPAPEPPVRVDGAVELRATTPGLLDGVEDVQGALDALLDRLPDHGYLAVTAYLDRERDAIAAQLRPLLARRARRPVTFGWGPRFLHSTGQYHKGGPATGIHLQVTGEPAHDLPVPGLPFSFGRIIAAQAAGDAQVVAGLGRPVLRLHLRDRAAGLEQLLAAAGQRRRAGARQ